MLNFSAHANRFKWILLIFLTPILAIFICHPGYSQEKAAAVIFPVKVYSVEEGLGQSSVYQVSQDSSGLIWLLSGGGLQYFDGSAFRSFYLPDELESADPGSSMSGFIETGPSQMLITTVSSIIQFNTETGLFYEIENKGRKFPVVFKRFNEDKPLCWMAPDSLFLVSQDHLSPITLKFQTGQKMPEGFIPVSAVTTREGSILLVGNNGYLKINKQHADQDKIWEAEWFSCNSEYMIACNDKDGEGYILSDGIIYSYQDKGILKEELKTGIKTCDHFFIDRDHNIWVSDISRKKVYRINEGRMEEIRFLSREGTHTDTLNPAVKNIFEDNYGNLWFGTDGSGLLFYSPDRLIFDLARIGFNRCLCFYEDEIWAGTFKNGLWRLPVDLSRKTRVNPAILTDELYFFDLKTDTSGRLWAATNKGVYVLNGKGDVVYHYYFNTSAANFLFVPGNKILLSTYDELYSCETGYRPVVTFIRNQTQVKELIEYQGSYWVGNHFGLFRKDSVSGVLNSLYFHDENRISSVPVYSLVPVDDGLWAGTENGIECYSSDGKKIPSPPCTELLKHEIAYSLLPDPQNRIWFSTNKGIGCITSARDRIIRFSLSNNLQSSEFNFNANLAIERGRIFFGGINGINGLNTNDFTIKDAAPEIRLITLNLSDTAYTNGIPPENLNLEIDWRSPHVSGTVFTPAYLPEGDARYSFLLDGYQESWSQPSLSTMFSFRNLPPGNYRLLARCIDTYENSGPVKCLMSFTIRPPFWKTGWFMAVSALLVIGLTVLIIRKMQEIKYQRLLLELEKRNAIDRERLRISQDMHDEIGSSLTQIAILSEIAKKKGNDKEESAKLIEKISVISSTVVDDLGEIIWAMNPRNDDLPSFVAYLREHASEYLSSAGIEGNFSFPEECPQIPMTSEQRRNIFLVVKEALHNVVRHSGANGVKVSLDISGNQLHIRIEDNGTGFEPDKCSGTGNGLTGMRSRIEALGGSYELTSKPGKGTFIRFSIHLTPNPSPSYLTPGPSPGRRGE